MPSKMARLGVYVMPIVESVDDDDEPDKYWKSASWLAIHNNLFAIKWALILFACRILRFA